MGRYRVQQAWDTAPWLHHWYKFQWSLIGNLGVDLIVIPLEALIGLEPAVKLIVICIPVLTAIGLLWVAREVHGKIPATALFALPLVYNFPLYFGFVNFSLSMAFALNAYALWLRMARQNRLVLRGIVFVPISFAIWVTHTYGWGLLGILAFSGELVRQRDRLGGSWHNWARAWIYAGLHCLVLTAPMIPMVLWRSGHVTGETGDWFHWQAKMLWVTQVFRDRWQLFDLACLGVVYLILFKGVRDRNIEYSRNLTLSALLLLAVFLLLPRIVFGSAYADMRLVPYILMTALIALRPKPGLSIRRAGLVAMLGLAFFLVRMGGTGASFYIYSKTYDREMAALNHVPVGARLLTLVGETCHNEWKMSRMEHIAGIALERRLAFANDQWSMAGGQLLTVRFPEGLGFRHDPSELITSVQCPLEYWRPVAVALSVFPRKAFDYLWLVQPPKYDPRLTQGLTPVWRDGTSVLFRIDHDQKAAKLRESDFGPYGRLMVARLRRNPKLAARILEADAPKVEPQPLTQSAELTPAATPEAAQPERLNGASALK